MDSAIFEGNEAHQVSFLQEDIFQYGVREVQPQKGSFLIGWNFQDL